MAIEAQFGTEYEYEYEFEAEANFNSWVNSISRESNFFREPLDLSEALTIEEAVSFRKSLIGTPEFAKYSDFVITRTKYSAKGFNQGLYWPDGTIVPLPINCLSDHSTLEKRENGLFLSFVTKDTNGGYSIYYMPLPNLKVKGPFPREVLIEALIY